MKPKFLWWLVGVTLAKRLRFGKLFLQDVPHENQVCYTCYMLHVENSPEITELSSAG